MLSRPCCCTATPRATRISREGKCHVDSHIRTDYRAIKPLSRQKFDCRPRSKVHAYRRGCVEELRSYNTSTPSYAILARRCFNHKCNACPDKRDVFHLLQLSVQKPAFFTCLTSFRRKIFGHDNMASLDLAPRGEADFDLFPYNPSAGAGYAFLVMFGITAVTHLILMIIYRSWYFVPFFLGCIGTRSREILPPWSISH